MVEKIQSIFSECLNVAEVAEGTNLFEDLQLDSIQQMTLVVEVENRFRIRLDEGDESGIATVGDLADLVEARLAEAERDGEGERDDGGDDGER